MSVHAPHAPAHSATPLPRAPKIAGLLAQFDDVDTVMAAAEYCRDQGFTRWDVHTPFPVHGMDKAMGIRPTILPWLVLCGGLTGLCTAAGVQWWANVFSYPFYASGKPIVSGPAWVPVCFELTILFSALTAVFGMFLLNGLPHHYNPLFKSRRFKRATNDRFFVVIDSLDPVFKQDVTEAKLQELGATAFEWIEDEHE